MGGGGGEGGLENDIISSRVFVIKPIFIFKKCEILPLLCEIIISKFYAHVYATKLS